MKVLQNPQDPTIQGGKGASYLPNMFYGSGGPLFSGYSYSYFGDYNGAYPFVDRTLTLGRIAKGLANTIFFAEGYATCTSSFSYGPVTTRSGKTHYEYGDKYYEKQYQPFSNTYSYSYLDSYSQGYSPAVSITRGFKNTTGRAGTGFNTFSFVSHKQTPNIVDTKYIYSFRQGPKSWWSKYPTAGQPLKKYSYSIFGSKYSYSYSFHYLVSQAKWPPISQWSLVTHNSRSEAVTTNQFVSQHYYQPPYFRGYPDYAPTPQNCFSESPQAMWNHSLQIAMGDASVHTFPANNFGAWSALCSISVRQGGFTVEW